MTWYVVVFLRSSLPRVFGPFMDEEQAQAGRRELADKDGFDPDLLVVARMEQR